MKRGPILLILLILITPMVQASIELTSAPESQYNIGEEIQINGIIKPTFNFLGKLRISLICGAKNTDMLLKVFNFEADEEISFQEKIYTFPTETKLCKIRVAVEDESTQIEYKDTKSFTLDSNLETNITVSSQSIQLGDEIKILGEIKNNPQATGSATITLKKSENTIQTISVPITNGKFNYQFTPVFLTSGQHTLSIETKDSFGNTKTNNFNINVNSDTKITLEIYPEEITPREDIEIKGFIEYKTEPESTNQKIIATFQNQNYTFQSSKESFSIDIPTTINTTSGTTQIKIQTIDLYGNKGTTSFNLLVHSEENYLKIETDKTEYLPEENIILKATLLDQSQKVIEDKINLKVKHPDEKLFNEEINSNQEITIAIPKHLAPEEIEISAETDNLESYYTVTIQEIRKITTEINNTDLIVTNIGNVRYQDTIDINLEGNITKTISKEIDLKAGETEIFDLTDEDLPASEYQVQIGDNSWEVMIPQIEANRKLILQTTGIIIALLIIFLIFWTFWTKKHKKSHQEVKEIVKENTEQVKHHKRIAKESVKKNKKLETTLQQSKEEKKKIKSLFNKFVDPTVTKELISTGNVMASEKKNVTAMFLDVRGFTSMSEKQDPWETRKTLNRYFDQISKIVNRNRGSINKYIGDAMLILFNAPKKIENHEKAAITTAIAIQRQVKIINEKRLVQGKNPLHIGIGINSGEAVVGGFGAGRRLEYTAIGDTINVASRLEGLSKKGQILITEEIYNKVSEIFEGDFLGKFKVKNKEKPLRVYNILGFRK